MNLSKIAMYAGVLLLYWFSVLVLNGGYPLGVTMGVERDLLFFVGAFGGYLPSISHIKLKFKWGKRSTINFYLISIG